MQAIWFTQNPGTEGPVFGNTEVWRGVGVMLDSFDNDGLVSIKDVHVSLLHFSYNLHTQHDNPKIQIVLNDGSRVYEHHSDGQKQELSLIHI